MRIGLPKEVKDNEYRVGLVPAGVHALVEAGHDVLVETHAGEGSGFSDAEYQHAGAKIVLEAAPVFDGSEMIVKVKEPAEPEYNRLHEGQILFTYLHLAPAPNLTDALLKRKIIGIAYETIPDRRGTLPLLTPMSEVAGRMAIQVGAHYLQRTYGGRGNLLGGVPGVPASTVVIIGGGIVGTNAAKVACGMGARVLILDIDPERMRQLDDIFYGRAETRMSNYYNIAETVAEADLVVGAVLIPGAAAPKLVTRKMISSMRKGTVVVDVAVDQGGCFETTRPTRHSDPTYEVDGVVHYCVANMPGAVPRTSTLALTNATLPYVLRVAEGLQQALKKDALLREGINVFRGEVTCKPVAEAQHLSYRPVSEVLGLS
ncbi:MAG TPA: alanine dehydrogenase [Acidobacteriota bacterium]|nr:alanine dehydrogenase [Acidobacteriota bacterium]